MIEWSAEQRALREGLERHGEELNAGHLERESEMRFPEGPWEVLGRSGLFGLPFGPEWGGSGRDLLTTMYVLEGLGRVCRDPGLNFSAVTHMVSTGIPVQRFGSRRLKDACLPGVVEGRTIGAHAISEPGAGSDALAMTTRAVPDGDGYVVNGAKAFVTNGPVADQFVVYARTDSGNGPLGLTAFLIGARTAGLRVGPPMEKMGLRTSPLSELTLDGCRVPRENVIGRPGSGYLVLDHVMRWEVLCSFVTTVGEMRHRLDRCIEYARTRRQFGAPIGSFQALSHKIVDMRIGVETARQWLYRTAERMVRGDDVTADVAMAKLVTSENNLSSALAAVQVFGGYGYLSESGLEKDVRAAVAGTIYSGTTEIQRDRVAAMLGLHRSKDGHRQRESSTGTERVRT
ncbi:alkylation response protein AidB-like acyl-CoA dehydrogenase [Nocardiopsis arvandica]|uniref:Alkylation response protein AidB-like acyl-CoA dehydrogenase n=1 Tax=Nocardiopsis sinuspersici TaxID=501010 RepID=A0A7Y9XHB4_9ACTN|nr:acyl-CoA dehydrogenase family protein [Nocardiopsis sinuspersici]NYH55673.1 alkylation response protein AidB-like acyl-CoA dehydrogenase [Nocardiopsis sinuspersici]